MEWQSAMKEEKMNDWVSEAHVHQFRLPRKTRIRVAVAE